MSLTYRTGGDRERDRETPRFFCYFCDARLEPCVLHYCSQPSDCEKRCGRCKAFYADNANHRCLKGVTVTDPDMEEIDNDVEAELSSHADPTLNVMR